MPKPLYFVGTSRKDISAFPEEARRKAGFQLLRVQSGSDPEDWKPMVGIGTSVREIRVRDESGAFRVIYVVSRQDAVYVLHAFQKKTEQTAKRDLDLAKSRLREIDRR